jgi:hydrogenase-4 transcriptional activator
MLVSSPMDSAREVLLDVWRETCRHLRMEESVENLARILAPHLPLEDLHVLAVEPGTGALVARGGRFAPPAHLAAHGGTAPRAAEALAVRRWIGIGDATFQRAGAEPGRITALLGLSTTANDWIVVPLSSEQGVQGILLLQLPPSSTLTAPQFEIVRQLVEPFSAALENDHRLHVLTTLSETAEATKRSALTRLGRDALIETIVGADAGLSRVMERVELVAGSDIAVLIIGETGAGKEVVARAIHERSKRSSKPFIRVNCGAISPELIDSELFGHEKGAFTGATATRRGWFERADGGTLLLDEIGELPLPAQVRLLRVVQEGVFERVGGERAIHVDVRLVAATHRDLPGMVQEGRFREDLWYRITGFQLLLPPLRERREDIPGLARHFVDRACRRFGMRPLELGPEQLALLASYPWPGNVRELGSVIDRAVILGEGKSLEVARALGGSATPGLQAPETGATRLAPIPTSSPAQVATLDQAMRGHIEAALAATGGRIEGRHGAARVLGINPHTLRARMRKLGIEWSRFRERSA